MSKFLKAVPEVITYLLTYILIVYCLWTCWTYVAPQLFPYAPINWVSPSFKLFLVGYTLVRAMFRHFIFYGAEHVKHL